MRVRSRTPHSTNVAVKTEKWVVNPTLAPPDDEVYTLIRDLQVVGDEVQEVMEDVVTPRFHSLRSKGGIANNPMTYTRTQVIDRPTSLYLYDSYDYRTGQNPDVWETIYTLTEGNQSTLALCNAKGGYLDAPALDEESLDSKSATKAMANVSLNEAYALVMLAESQKTVYSLCSITKRFIKVLKAIKRLDGRALRGELTGKQLSDRYMELRYAIRPLMYDANGVVEALKYKASDTTNRLTFRGHEFADDRVDSWDTYPNGNWTTAGMNYVRDWSTYRETEIKYDVRSGVLTQLKTLSSLPVWGLAEPIESAWELIPFSFIVDWFFNVGDTIAAWTPNFGLDQLASWTVSTKMVKKECTIDSSTAGILTEPTDPNFRAGEHRNMFRDGYCSDTTITKVRTPNPELSILPTKQFRLDVLKLADLLIIGKKIFFSRR